MPKMDTMTAYLDHHDNLHRRIVDKALSDTSFRGELEADPKAALARELGVELPAEVNVRVVRESESDIVIVLPDVRKHAAEEIQAMTDEELKTAAMLPIDCRTSWYYTWSVYDPEQT
jgi:hypothetical protein